MNRILSLSHPLIYLFFFCLCFFSCSDRRTSFPTTAGQQSIGNDFELEVVTDVDGNIYPIKNLGGQLWMAENLRVTHYRNGDPIAEVTDREDWAAQVSGAYCVYGDDPDNAEIYGLLYNWHAVNEDRILAPAGWHIPTDREWQILIDFLGGSTVAGGSMKDSSGWDKNGNGNNISQFTALPGGVRNSSGLFNGIGYSTSFWSSSKVGSDGAWGRWLSYLSSAIGRDDGNRLDGFSVRCIKD